MQLREYRAYDLGIVADSLPDAIAKAKVFYAQHLEQANKIEEPRNTAVVLISDFFEGGSNQVLLDYIKGLKDSGVHFIPVGAVTSSGYYSVCEWFRARLKEWLPEAEAHPLRLGFVAQMIDNGFVFDGPHWRLPESPLQGLYFRCCVAELLR